MNNGGMRSVIYYTEELLEEGRKKLPGLPWKF
jgi:hypothetical protein